jgi:diguanylate cyclase (GGDEF)-like protein/PAS domain S-box-containing protein
MLREELPTAAVAGTETPDAAFALEHARHLGAEGVERTLTALLDRFPTAPVGALTAAGLYVEMPATIALRGNPVLHGRSGLDGMSDGDRTRMLENWDRVLAVGAGRCVIDPPGYPPTMVWGLDLRERHGIVFILLTPADGGEQAPDPPLSVAPVPPRFAAIRKDELGFIVGIDEATSEILGWSTEEMKGHRSLDFVHPDDHRLATDNWVQMLAHPGPARRVRQRLRRRDGTWCWFEVTNHNLLADPTHGCVVAEMVDISDEMAAHEALREREQLLDRLAAALPVGVVQIDAEGGILYTNERLHDILGVGEAATAAEQLSTVAESDRPGLAEAVAAVLEQATDRDIEVAVEPPGAEPRVCTVSIRALTHDDGSVTGAIACVVDVTDSTRMRDELRRRATTDELTGCLNRASIVLALEQHISSGQRRAERAVLFIDLDRFKQVNDEHGHAAGDELLRELGRRLRATLREGDAVGRVGGDEFLVLCPDVGGPDEALGLAARVAAELRNDMFAAGGRTASVGVAWTTGTTLSADGLVARADRAMYESKRAGTGAPVLDALSQAA